MEGENVFGSKIKVEISSRSPQKTDKQQGKNFYYIISYLFTIINIEKTYY